MLHRTQFAFTAIITFDHERVLGRNRVLLAGGKEGPLLTEERPPFLLSRFEERQKIGVDDVGMRRGHTVREARINLERAVLQQLRR